MMDTLHFVTEVLELVWLGWVSWYVIGVARRIGEERRK